MDDLIIARAVHILALIHWIGGVTLVTTVILPAVSRFSEPSRRIAAFEEIEGRFSFQAKISVILAGLSGFYLTDGLEGWYRFTDPQYWWMHAMVGVWAIFIFVLFVAEPFFLHAWFRSNARRDPDKTFALLQRFHWGMLAISLLTVGGAMLGAHGFIF